MAPVIGVGCYDWNRIVGWVWIGNRAVFFTEVFCVDGVYHTQESAEAQASSAASDWLEAHAEVLSEEFTL